MGDEQEFVRVRASGSPTRCPFCHADVDREREDWVACESCLARHHVSCWHEGNGCAGCGETRFVARERAGASVATVAGEVAPPAGTAPGPTLPVVDLELRGRRVHFEGDAKLVMALDPARASEPFEVRVRNFSEAPQTVELRRLPGWLRVEGEARQLVPPGTTAVFRVSCVTAAVPASSTRPVGGRSGRTRGLPAFSTVAEASFTLATDDDSTTVTLEAWTAMSSASRLRLAALLGLVFHVGIPFFFVYLVTGRPAVRRPDEDDNAFLFRRREAEVRRAISGTMARVFGVYAALAALFAAAFFSLR